MNDEQGLTTCDAIRIFGVVANRLTVSVLLKQVS